MKNLNINIANRVKNFDTNIANGVENLDIVDIDIADWIAAKHLAIW